MAYPTETVYGLGCSAFERASLVRIHALKGDDPRRPFILLVPGFEWLEMLASCTETARALAAAFWPGPLTLVLEARRDLPHDLLGEGGTIAMRHSPSPFVQDLFRFFHEPLVSTSANPHGLPPATDAAGVVRYFGGHPETIDVLVEYPGTMIGTASTVVSLLGGHVSVLREGALPTERVREALRQIP